MSSISDAEALKHLRDRSITKLVVAFSGSGDEGFVDSVTATQLVVTNAAQVATGAPPVVREMEFGDGGVAGQLSSSVREWADELAYKASWDWCNNEGGAGEVTVDVATGIATYTGSYNEVHAVPIDSYAAVLEPGAPTGSASRTLPRHGKTGRRRDAEDAVDGESYR